MPPRFPLISLLIVIICLVGCASKPEPVEIDREELARAILEEQARLDAAKQANLPAPEPLPQQTHTAPVWQLQDAHLQHIASGYQCPAEASGFQMTDDEIYPGLGHGNDVACVYVSPEGGAVKLHLTNFGRDVSAAAHFKGVATSIADTYSVTRPAPVPTVPGASAIRQAGAYQIKAVSDRRPDVPVHTAIWIERVGPWHIKARATYEADQASAIASLITTLFARTDQITLRSAPEPEPEPAPIPSTAPAG